MYIVKTGKNTFLKDAITRKPLQFATQEQAQKAADSWTRMLFACDKRPPVYRVEVA